MNWLLNYDIPNEDHYIALAKRTIKLIREIAPDVKIVMGSFNQFIHEQTLESCDELIGKFFKAIRELGRFVDVIGYHPFYQPTVSSERYLNYPNNIRRFKKYCEELGFDKDRYMASEFGVGAMYPPTIEGTSGCWWGQGGKINFSEIEKAKILSQFLTIHTAFGIESMYCELSNDNYPLELSLLILISNKRIDKI